MYNVDIAIKSNSQQERECNSQCRAGYKHSKLANSIASMFNGGVFNGQQHRCESKSENNVSYTKVEEMKI